MLRKEGVVSRIEYESRHADALEPGHAGGPRPVVVRIAEAVQRRGHYVVEFVERARRAQARGVVEPGEARQLGERLGPERGEEVPGVDQALQALVERAPGGADVERRRNGG